jgi:hypothetical protein
MTMKTLTLMFAAAGLLLASCGEPNHYDSHKGQEPDSHTENGRDTIQGRAPDSTVVVSDSSNIGIGDTTLGKMR